MTTAISCGSRHHVQFERDRSVRLVVNNRKAVTENDASSTPHTKTRHGSQIIRRLCYAAAPSTSAASCSTRATMARRSFTFRMRMKALASASPSEVEIKSLAKARAAISVRAPTGRPSKKKATGTWRGRARLTASPQRGSQDMWTLILVTLVFSGSVTGGAATNTTFLDFVDEAKCRTAAAAMEASERVGISDRAGRQNISPPSYYRIVARCVER